MSLLPILTGQAVKSPLHKAVICHSVSGVFIVRKGKWKLQFSAGSGGWSQPRDAIAIKQGLPKWQLYDLTVDPKESNNLINTHPDVVKELTDILYKFVHNGRSTPGTPQKNHEGAVWWEQLPWEQNT